jgi:sarcosine oxidase subunit beta
MKQRADIVIIGGGIIGVSIAYHLARKKVKNLVLVEKGSLGEGSTGLCVGGIRTQFATDINIRLSLESLEFWAHFEELTGVDPEFRQVGYLFLATNPEAWDLFQRNVGLQKSYGVPVELLGAQEIHCRWPFLRSDDLLGGTFCALDGFAGPHEALTGMVQIVREEGVKIHEQTEVVGLRKRGGRVVGVKTRDGEIDTQMVVNAAGPWASVIGRLAGIEIPVKPLRRQLFVTAPFSLSDQPIPVVIDFDRGWYFRQEGAGFLLSGPVDKEPSFRTAIDHHAKAETAENAITRVPAFQNARITGGWGGLYEISPDHHAILGPVSALGGLVLANGFSGHGFQHSPAVGRIIADFVTNGATSDDLSLLSLERFEKGARIEEPLTAFKE